MKTPRPVRIAARAAYTLLPTVAVALTLAALGWPPWSAVGDWIKNAKEDMP